jgi:molybdopterin synthase sulfur carrier subunit
VRIRYFAWLRERVGVAEEEVEPPEDVATVGDLVGWLKGRGPQFAHAFENEAVVRAAIDNTHASSEARLVGAREVAFFPPMTGG